MHKSELSKPVLAWSHGLADLRESSRSTRRDRVGTDSTYATPEETPGALSRRRMRRDLSSLMIDMERGLLGRMSPCWGIRVANQGSLRKRLYKSTRQALAIPLEL
ncbi:hypothetical protein VTK56DRAFT_10020 [Thermocarpiscus australiensis]